MTIDVNGKKVVLTGALSSMTRAQATEKLEDYGAIVTGSVTSKTEILFVGDRPGSKLEKAEGYGIPIYDETKLMELFGEAPPAGAGSAPKAEVLQEIEDGEELEVQGSAADPYILKNVGGVYSCSCPAWKNQSLAIDKRTCKHLREVRGDAAEDERVGGEVSLRRKAKGSKKPKLLLAQKWESHVDPTGWWMSEKLDGVRAYWNGETFFSRLGNEFLAPDWFRDGLPEYALDGELWMDRGAFQKTVSVVRRQDRGKAWQDVKFVIFDAPDYEGQFEDRYDYISSTYSDGELEYALALEHILCEGVDHLSEELERVEGLGGEGLMLRKAKSKYVRSRSATLLKVKTFHDAEAMVEGYTGGQGKHRNRVGSLNLITPEGIRFSCGSGLSDAEREDPPAVGSIVTYRFQELTDAGVPRFPTYIGERADAEWPADAVTVSRAQSPTKPKSKTAKKAIPKKKAVAKAKTTKKKSTPKKSDDMTTVTLEKKGDVLEISRDGDSVTLTFGSADDAEEEMDRLIGQKMKRGYVMAEGDDDDDGGDEESGDLRRFEYVGGSSSKFWEITVSGDTHTVRYGRIGNNGATKEKSFKDAEAAQKDADKLIRQKTGKGYEEVDPE